METLDWGYCPELAFVKGQPYFETLEKNDPRAAFAFAKFIQIVHKPARKPDPANPKDKWKVPDVPDEAVFWYELLKGNSNAQLAGKDLVKAIGAGIPGVPKTGALHSALNQL